MMEDQHECQPQIGKPTEQDRGEDQEEEGVVDVVDVDKRSREKEKDKNMN